MFSALRSRLRPGSLLVGGVRPARVVPALASLVALSVALSPVAVGADVAPAPPTAGRPAASPYGTSVTIAGHGYGHGIGMSQWGALGYAVDHGWSSQQILDHYYGNTTSGTIADDPISVRLVALDGAQTTVVAPDGLVTTAEADPAPAERTRYRTIVARPLGSGRYEVWGHPSEQRCPGAADAFDGSAGWVQISADRPADITAPIDFLLPGETVGTARESLMAVCEPGGTVRSYRGTLRAVVGTDLVPRTVNIVPVETYLRGVVPVEVSAGWAGLGGGAGMEAVKAQAVAARSYGMLQSRYTYAKTCDTQACQVYSGAGRRSSLGAAYVAIEHVNTDTAIAATAGVVRRTGSGGIANTMFSSSSGGYTAPSTSPGFPAVVDEGDDIAANPNHDWTTSVPVSKVETLWPAIGTLTQITVTERNGLGADGGRVKKLQIEGTTGRVTLTGDDFRRALDLKSDWFSVAGDACSGRIAPAIDGSSVATTASGVAPISPTRLVDTRNGIGTAAIELGAGCTLAFSPGTRPSGTVGAALVLTTTNAEGDGYTTAYPCGTAQPNVSAVQILRGVDVAGTTVVPLGADGRICLYASVTTDILVDVTGWTVPNSPAYRGTDAPQRVLDTRLPAPQPLVKAGTETRVRVVGPDGSVPAAVSVNVTATNARTTGYVTAYPCDASRSETSVLNFRGGVDIANRVFVDVDVTGAFCLWASADVHLVVDLDGVFSASDPAARPLRLQAPARAVDTRSAIGTVGALAPGVVRSLDLGDASGGVLMEITVVDPTTGGYLTMYPCDSGGQAPTSVLNAPRATNVANTVLMRTDGDGRICVVASMATHLLVDVIGRV